MKKQTILYITASIAILLAAFTAANKLLKRLQYKGKTAYALGIIGGSDGPTAVCTNIKNPIEYFFIKLYFFFVRPFVPSSLCFF